MLGCCFRNKDGLFHVHERTVLRPPGRQFCFDTPKNLLGEQSHRHKPRVPSAETQRAQVHPTPSVSTKVLPSAEPDVRGTSQWADSPAGEERRPTEDRWPAGEGKSCFMSGTPLLELLAHCRLTIWSV
uniref:Uncharacterized protein n=1 Tax=Pipistrellus kuhlii TaxID=59472 RepID=A0A7J7TXJ3_PIPKU|nr:hypothetical protein mPipKuh1_009205 [Pipistrellus kuhlii]